MTNPDLSAAADYSEGAEAAHLANMLRIYTALDAIAHERMPLAERETALRCEVVNALGVKVGDVIEQRGQRFQVLDTYGDFEFIDKGPHEFRISAVARCDGAPATASGFHSRRTITRSVFDATGFPSPHVRKAAPAEDEPAAAPRP